MNQRILILIVGILAGAAVAYFVPRGTRNPEVPAPAETVASTPESPANNPEPPPPVRRAPRLDDTAPRAATVKPAAAPVSAWTRLAEKYGHEKAALSSKITSNITSVISEGIELAKTAAKNSGAKSLSEAAAKEILRNATSQLGLSEEQQKQAAEVIEGAVNKRMTAVTDLTSAMASEPEQIMEMLLAGDQLARKEISQEEYDRITAPTRAMLQNVAGFITGRSAGGGGTQYLMDPDTSAKINSILTPEQQTKLAEITAAINQEIQTRQAAQANSGFPFQPGQIPVMDLERLDQSVASMRQMAEAARQMMEAMRTMKEANAQPGTR